jgi:hypothetical protein
MLQTILIKECSINPSGTGRRDGEGMGQEGEGGKEVGMMGRIPVGNGQYPSDLGGWMFLSARSAVTCVISMCKKYTLQAFISPYN